MYLTMLWGLRFGFRDEIKTNGKEEWFWDWLKKRVDIEGAELHLADSHTFCYDACADIDRIILFDAHHDCWNGKQGHVHCHDWARRWLEEDAGRQLTWVKPGHELCSEEQMKEMRERVKSVPFSGDLKLDIDCADVVYICRSGCWTPPWLDQAFIDFVEEEWDVSSATAYQDGEWNPMSLRWSKKKMEEIADFHREKMRVMEEMHELAVRGVT